MVDCLFCEKYAKGDEVIYENEFFYSQFDRFPISPGHSEVIPKRHVVNLKDLTAEEWANFFPAIQDTIGIIKATNLEEKYISFLFDPVNETSARYCHQTLGHPGLMKTPDAYNHGLNDGEAAGRSIHHLHWHIIPRFNGDVENPKGGVRHIIEGKGNY